MTLFRKHSKRWGLFLLSVLLCLLSGCRSQELSGDYREISATSFIAGAAVDYTEDGLYELTMELIDFSDSNLESGLKTTLLVSQGESVSIAAQAASAQLGNAAYWSHLETILVSPDVAKAGLGGLVDFLLYNVDTGLTITLVLTVTERASDILRLDSRDTGVISYDIQKIIANSEWYAAAISPHFFGILEELTLLDSCAIIGEIGAVGEDDTQYPALVGAAALSNAVFMWELSEDYLLPYTLLQNTDAHLRFSCTTADGQPHTVEVTGTALSHADSTGETLLLNADIRLCAQDTTFWDGQIGDQTFQEALECSAAEALQIRLSAFIEWAKQHPIGQKIWWVAEDYQYTDFSAVTVSARLSSFTAGPGAPFNDNSFWKLLYG